MSCLNILNEQGVELYCHAQPSPPHIWSLAAITASLCKSLPDANWQGLAQLMYSVPDLTLQAVGPKVEIWFL